MTTIEREIAITRILAAVRDLVDSPTCGHPIRPWATARQTMDLRDIAEDVRTFLVRTPPPSAVSGKSGSWELVAVIVEEFFASLSSATKQSLVEKAPYTIYARDLWSGAPANSRLSITIDHETAEP